MAGEEVQKGCHLEECSAMAGMVVAICSNAYVMLTDNGQSVLYFKEKEILKK